ncbi:MAG: hypothetical protein J0I19_15550 [Alphaproteobacteria bacterium]|nr:hypothetical protein [Alphaproteobacteria bacterium]
MRISKSTLDRGWLWSSVLGLIVFAVLGGMDLWLKSLTGVSTTDLQGLATAAQFRLAFHAWAPEPYAVRAGFDLGLDYLLMPLYAVSFFLSSVVVAESFTPGKSRFRRYVLMAGMVAPIGALLDAIENVLQLDMLLNGPTDDLARIAYNVSSAKTVAVTVGVVLLITAVVAKIGMRKARAMPVIEP